MKRRRRVARRLLEAIAVAAVVAALTAFGLNRGTFEGFQNSAIDRLFPSAQTDPAVVVVGIDEKTIQARNFPLARSDHATLARLLTDAGAKVIAWDVAFFSSPENTLERPNQAAQTQDFADALKEASDAGVATVLAVDTKLRGPGPDGVRMMEPTFPNQILTDAATVDAHVGVEPDPNDSVVRRLPLVLETPQRQFLPSLSLAATLAYRGAQLQPVLSGKGVQAGGRFVPTERDAYLRLNYAEGLDGETGRRSLVSALDLLNCAPDSGKECTLRPSQFKNKIVLIGATAQSSGDLKEVPIDKSGGIPGVFVHANAVNTMLTSSYLRAPSDTDVVLWSAFLAFLVAAAVLFLPLWLALVGSIALAIGYLSWTVARFQAGHIQNVVYPIATIVIAFVAAVMVRYFTETRQRRRVSKLFAQYVPETVAQQLEETGRIDKAIEGERLDVSLFFCDLRGFTALSATLAPQQVRILLNEFYDCLTEIILQHNGTVLKFVGDEVFAVFGAPLPVAHHADVALECAISIQEHTPVLSQRLEEMGLPAVHFGIGMNTGDVVAAHVGGGRRRQYDIVGDTVNIGSRMCGQADKGDIVMPITMYEVLENPPPAESMGLVALKNVERPIELMRIRIDAPTEPEPETPSATMTA